MKTEKSGLTLHTKILYLISVIMAALIGVVLIKFFAVHAIMPTRLDSLNICLSKDIIELLIKIVVTNYAWEFKLMHTKIKKQNVSQCWG